MSNNQHTGVAILIEEGWFKDSSEGLVLVGSRCGACSKVFFPKKIICPNCFDGELREIHLSRTGKLHSFAQSILGPSEMEKPYVMGFIDLPEGVKLYSLLTDCEPWDEVLKIDMEMEMVMGKIKEDPYGNEIIGYKFRPIKGEVK